MYLNIQFASCRASYTAGSQGDMTVLCAIRLACCLHLLLWTRHHPQIDTSLSCQIEDFRIQSTIPYARRFMGNVDLTGSVWCCCGADSASLQVTAGNHHLNHFSREEYKNYITKFPSPGFNSRWK